MPITLPSSTLSEVYDPRYHSAGPLYVWAVYRWSPRDFRWYFIKFWRLKEHVGPRLFAEARCYMDGPPGWHDGFNPLPGDESCFFVHYPTPEIVELIFDTTDNRFNDKDET